MVATDCALGDDSRMEAIILAGGIGSRLQSVVADVPKPMAEVAGRPFLEYQLDYLAWHGVSRVVLAVSHLHEKISGHFGAAYGEVELMYSIERERLGTGGGVKLAMAQVGGDDFLVLNGDSFFDAPLAELLQRHHECESPAPRDSNAAADRTHAAPHDMTIALKRVPDCSRFGSVETDANGRLVGWREKGIASAGAINAGVYVVRRAFMESLPHTGAFSLERDVMEREFASRRFVAVESDGYFIDIGVPEEYARAQTELPRVAARYRR